MIPDPALFAGYVGTVVMLAFAPGTDNIYILTQTLSHGRRAGFLATTGIAGALCIHVTAVTLGLSHLIAASPTLYQVMKWAGIAYLMWLAWRAFRAADDAAIDLAAARNDAAFLARRIMVRGFLLALLNPKLAVFFIAFLPQFVVPGAGAVTLQLLVLGVSFAGISLTIFVGLIIGVAPLGDWLRRHPTFPIWQARATGAVLGGMALWLIVGGR